MHAMNACAVCEIHDLVGTILTVGMYLLAMHLSHTHSAESSVVSRLYASSLMPVHSLSREKIKQDHVMCILFQLLDLVGSWPAHLWYHCSQPLSQKIASSSSLTSRPHPPQGYTSLIAAAPLSSAVDMSVSF